jgi:hypothetical protein
MSIGTRAALQPLRRRIVTLPLLRRAPNPIMAANAEPEWTEGPIEEEGF